jgi:hypothetical protein
VVIRAEPLSRFRICQFAGGLGNGAVAMPSCWFNAIEAGTLARQLAQHSGTTPGVLDPLVMGLHPGPNGLADVPRGVIPDHQERLLAFVG